MVEFVIGIGVGLLLYYVFGKRTKFDGTYIIDVSDPMKDVCRLELNDGPLSAWSKKKIVLQVKTYGELSQN